MNKIKVYLQYPWKFPDSPYYKYLIDSPPNDIEFLNVKKQKGVITNKRFFWVSNFLKKNIRGFANLFQLSIPNAHLSPDEDYDLIHCAHCLSKNKNKPWVADIEMIASLAISGSNSDKGKKKIRKILLSKNCKKILPWTNSVKDDLLRGFPEIEDKLEVVYPAVPFINNLNKSTNKNLKIIFVARYFDIKGGLIALEVLERLRKKYGIEGIVISNVPINLKNKYSQLKIYDLMPQQQLFDLMKDSDLFLYPSSVDTFGFSLLEAMSFGLPVITINTSQTLSRLEIIENNKTGLIFDVNSKLSYDKLTDIEFEIVDKLVKNASKLIEDPKFLKIMLNNCLKEIRGGKFSIKERNERLEGIYRGALK
jgi:glycosyltransferase involved in cell wall biosynthesis